MVNWVTNKRESPTMKVSSVILIISFGMLLEANDAVDRARQLEKSGDVAGARAA